MEVKVLRRSEAMSQPRAMSQITSDDQLKDVDVLPTCQAHRSTSYCPSWEAANPDKTCRRIARYEVDGVPLCGQHAGEVALSEILKK